jgi:hypothetical protein
LTQDVGLRVLFALRELSLAPSPEHERCRSGGGSPDKDMASLGRGQPCDDLRDETQLRVQTAREDCTVVRRQDFVNQDHSASGHAQRSAQLVRDMSLLVLGRPVIMSLKEITLPNGISEPADWKLQLIDSIQQALLQCRGTRNARDIARARNRNAPPIGQEFKPMS